MTVSTQTSRVEHVGNGSTTAFSVNFYFLAAGDLKVYQGGVLKTLTTHYTVSGAGNPAGGTVTFLTAPTNGQDVVILRDPALTQGVDYQPNDPFPAETHERALDRLTMISQRLKDRMDRAVIAPDSDTGSPDMVLPVADDRAGTVLAFDENGLPVAGPDVASVGTVAANIANINTVAGNTTNINTVAGISGNVSTVAGIAGNVTTVANNSGSVNVVAADIAAVAAVAGNSININVVASSSTSINTVASNIANVNSVAGNAANINAVAGNATNINAVAGNATNINAVNANKTNIDAVAGISTDVTVVAQNVADVTNFADVYQGPKTANPTARNDSTALQAGDLYFNTVSDRMRVYNGSSWDEISYSSITVERFSGTGSQTAFTLASAPANEDATQVYISGVYQQKDRYSVSGTTLTFSSAPPAGTDNIEVVTLATVALGQTSSNLVSYTPAGVGAVATTVQTKLREFVSVKDFGAMGDNTSDDTAEIQAAIDAVSAAGGGLLYFPAGTYLVTGLVLKDAVKLVGSNKRATTIKLANSANQHVIRAGDFDTNANGVFKSTPLGCRTGGLADITIDGNKANQSSTKHGVAYYGLDLYLENVEVKNCKGWGIYTESPGNVFSVVAGLNLQYSWAHIESHDNDSGNITFNGQSDSTLLDLVCYETGSGAGQANFVVGPKATGCRLVGLHCWGTSDYAIISEAALTEFDSTHAESAAVAKVWAKEKIIWTGGRIYEAGTNTAAVGFKLDKDYNNIKGVTATNIRGGLVDTSAGGVAGQFSQVEILGYTAAAGSTLSVGTLSSTSDWSLRLFGSTTANYLYSSQAHTFAGGLTANAKITAGAGGLDMNVNGIDRCSFFAANGWASVSVASNTLTVSTSNIVVSEGAPVNVNDIVSSAGQTGILEVTIRNSGSNAVTFVHNTSKLRNISGANVALGQHQSITYTWISGTVWQQTGGKI